MDWWVLGHGVGPGSVCLKWGLSSGTDRCCGAGEGTNGRVQYGDRCEVILQRALELMVGEFCSALLIFGPEMSKSWRGATEVVAIGNETTQATMYAQRIVGDIGARTIPDGEMPLGLRKTEPRLQWNARYLWSARR